MSQAQDLRRFNQKGLEAFRTQLGSLRAGTPGGLTDQLLVDPQYSERLASAAVEKRDYKTKLELATHVSELLTGLAIDRSIQNVGLWSWLAAFWFDSLCPVGAGGRRKVLADALYILDAGNWQRVYRHLVAGPCELLAALPDSNRFLLCHPINVHPDIIEQVSGRLYIVRKRALREAMDTMYFDAEAAKLKRGVVSRNQAGTVFRLIKVAQQLDCTLDLGGLTGAQLMAKLPREFRRWATQP